MMTVFQKTFGAKLKQLEAQNRLRSLKPASGIDLSANDYLGMAVHEALREAAVAALQGGMALGSGASRLLRGNDEAHAALEEYAAAYFGSEKALFFGSGFQANYAIFTTLPSRHDIIIYDEFVHASARDGIIASHAEAIRVRHNDLSSFEDAIKKAQQNRRSDGQIWIAVESLYSMEGDFAPIKDLHKMARACDAILIVDEAHATGIWGTDGKGLAYGLDHGNLITLHTCGKSIGVAGGLVCAPAVVIDYLINAARPFIYSTAPMPLQAFLVQKSLEVLASKDGQTRREELQQLCATAQETFGGPGSQILPIILGDDALAVATAHELQNAGYDIRAIRPPTVPEGTARLRLSLSTHITEDILQQFAARLMPYWQKEAA
jgi:8-amino-7-oxononanoate synthase